MRAYIVFASPTGPLTAAASTRAVKYLSFTGAIPHRARGERPPLLREATAQLAVYFKGIRRNFGLPMENPGAPFQEAAWNALRAVTPVHTRIFAVSVGNPEACRAIGTANAKKTTAVIIPCQRVTGCNGPPTGFGGGLDVTNRLPDLEKRL